jgi:hydroxymethylglutaryl-CoA synthase
MNALVKQTFAYRDKKEHFQMASHNKKHFGVVGMNVHIPAQYVEQSKYETFTSAGAGKITTGLGQTRMSFVDSNEDIVSLMLTALQGLLDKTGIAPHEVGRLEVGTETLIDKSKATKTSLMRLLDDNGDIEGVDTINACYGGTNALFNSLNWLTGAGWDGRYAIVVCGDIAVYENVSR